MRGAQHASSNKPRSRSKNRSNLSKKRRQRLSGASHLDTSSQIKARKKQKQVAGARLGDGSEWSRIASFKFADQPGKCQNIRDGSMNDASVPKEPNQSLSAISSRWLISQLRQQEGRQAPQCGAPPRSRSISKSSPGRPAYLDPSARCLSINIPQAQCLGQRGAPRAPPGQSSCSIIDQSLPSGHRAGATAGAFFNEPTIGS